MLVTVAGAAANVAGAALLDLVLLNARTYDFDRLDMVVRLVNGGLPQELITRMEALWNETKYVAGEVIHVGKIIMMKIWEFVEANPNMAIGIAIGAAVGALVNMIPFFGPLLAPIVAVLSAVIGGIAGHRIDKRNKGLPVGNGIVGIAEDVITMAKEFFKLFAEIFFVLREHFSS
jgi:hypothetical protein